VIHRDLKPENILLQHGQPVVADFGIALAVSKAGGQRVTQTGLSLGTPQYMSPEQATGDRHIDGRSDIYSLGAILYEMLTGDPPHTASTAQGVIAKLLTEQPQPVSGLRASVPDHVAAAVHRALEKLPADRFATVRELCEALGTPGRIVAAPRTARTARARTWSILPWAIAAAGVVVAAVAMGILMWRPPAVGRAPVVLPLPYPDSVAPMGGAQRALALSNDGGIVVYGGAIANTSREVGLYVRRLDNPAPRLLPGTERARWPFFSPDGRALYFIRDAKLHRMSIDGGSPTLEGDSVLFASIGDRGSLLLDRGGTVARIPAGSREAVPVPIDDRMGTTVFASRFPEFLPGERYLLATIRPDAGGPREIAIVEVESGALTRLGLVGAHARYSATSHILYATGDGRLMAVPFSARSRRVTGPAQPVAESVALGANGAAAYAISHTGALAVLHGATAEERYLEIVDANAQSTRATTTPRHFGWPVLSPDARRVAVEVGERTAGPWDVWVFDLDSRSLSRLTTEGRGIRPGGWLSSDTVVFLELGGDRRLAGDNTLRAVAQAWDGSGTPRLVLESDRAIQAVSVGPRGSWVAAAVGRLVSSDIVIAPLDSPRAVRTFVATPAHEGTPRVSPDGTLLAYVSDESGRAEVYVRPIARPGARIQVSVDGGAEPVWDRDGKALYYRDLTALVRAQLAAQPDLRVASRTAVVANTRLVGGVGGSFYDVFPDGRRVLAVTTPARRMSAMLYLNWPGLLAPATR
jgi:serine/threonine-protein kinase